MDQPPRMGGGESGGDLAPDPQDLGGRQPALPLQPIGERFPLEQRHRQIGQSAIFAHLIDRDDVVMFEGGDGAGLPQEPLFRHRTARDRRRHDLQGDTAA
jgi:hypothetical protein